MFKQIKMGRAATNKIFVITDSSTTLPAIKNNGDVPVWDEQLNEWVAKAASDHDHDIGNQVLLFENQLI